MRQLILNELREQFNENGELTTEGDDDVIADFAQVEAMSDEALLSLYTWTVGFQG